MKKETVTFFAQMVNEVLGRTNILVFENLGLIHAGADVDPWTLALQYLPEKLKKYVQLLPGDILVTNDIALGNCKGNEIALVHCQTVAGSRFYIGTKLILPRTCDLRIPPCILERTGKVESVILEALAASAPQGLPIRELLTSAFSSIRQVADHLKRLHETKLIQLEDKDIRSYLRHCTEVSENLVELLPFDEASTQMTLEGNRNLQMQLKHLDTGVELDLRGTGGGLSTTDRIGMTADQTQAVLLWTLGKLLRWPCYNVGFFSTVTLSKPQGSWVSQTQLQNPDFMEIGRAALSKTLELVFKAVTKKSLPTLAFPFPIEILFQANSNSYQLNFCELSQEWGQELDSRMKINQIEKEIPVLTISLTSQNQNKSRAVSASFQALHNFKMQLKYEPGNHKPGLVSGAWAKSRVELSRKGSRKTIQSGDFDVNEGDLIFITTGHGYSH